MVAYTKNGKITSKVRKMAAAGCTVREIFSSIQSHQNAPASMTTFYKYYGEDLEAAKAEVTELIGSKVIQQAKEGDFRSQELYLTTKGGWSKNQTNTNVEITNEENSPAMEILLQKLGVDKKEPT